MLFKFHSFNTLSFAMNVVGGRNRTFDVFQPMDTCFIGLKDDIHCDLFFKWIQWMIWFQMGTLCDLSLSWIHLMVLRFMVEKLEWHPKLNVLWVFKWKPRVWVVGFGLVNSLSLVPFYIFHFFLFNLAFLVHV